MVDEQSDEDLEAWWESGGFAELVGHLRRGTRGRVVEVLVGAVLSFGADCTIRRSTDERSRERLREWAEAATDRLLSAYDQYWQQDRRAGAESEEQHPMCFAELVTAELQPWVMSTRGQRRDVRASFEESGKPFARCSFDDDLSRLAEQKGIPIALLRRIVERFAASLVPSEQILRRLEARVAEFVALRERLGGSAAAAALAPIRECARRRLDAGDLDGALELFVQACQQCTGGDRAALISEEALLYFLDLRYWHAARKWREAADLSASDADARAHFLVREASALHAQGREFGDDGALRASVDVYREALRERTRARAPLDWASTQNSLGAALRALGVREDDPCRLEQAVEAYRLALLERTRERVPLDWASTQNGLGMALRALGEWETGTIRLEQAAEAYQLSLLERTRDRVPLEWAETQSNLGNVFQRLAERDGDARRLQQAVESYRLALLESTRDRVPSKWAATQNNLGAALSALGERETGTRRLEQAVQAYQLALLERTRERTPLEWARTQCNLGTALRALGERESGTECLQAAVRAYRRALLEIKPNSGPRHRGAVERHLQRALEL
ncbi:MAG TPA: tetratricopeptide repeat protein, partial [Polyangiaceae bacterium]|nr:tetratricopeptide repeat protein [Polyangiaceae bacterium]